jgi:hypothetical protein
MRCGQLDAFAEANFQAGRIFSPETEASLYWLASTSTVASARTLQRAGNCFAFPDRLFKFENIFLRLGGQAIRVPTRKPATTMGGDHRVAPGMGTVGVSENDLGRFHGGEAWRRSGVSWNVGDRVAVAR